MRAVLRLPAYRRLLGAYTLNELAWAIGSLALALLVYRRTGSAIGAMAYFLCEQFVPAVLAPALVARIDQRSVRTVLPILYVLEAIAFLLLAWTASKFLLVPVLALTVLDGILAVSARPLARAASVAVTIPAGLLREGNALANTSFSICYMAGPALGAVIVVAGGTTAALLANSGLFIVIALVVATAKGLPDATREPAPAAGRLRAAVAQARKRPSVRTILELQVFAVLIFTIGIPVEVVFAQHSLHSGAGGYGALLSAWGGGAVLGSLFYARWRRLPSRSLIVLGAISLGGGMIVMAAAPSLAVAVIGALLAGFANGIEVVAVRTALQEEVQQRWMALTMSLSESIFQAVPGGGILIGGALAALAGPRAALAAAGGGAMVVAAVARKVLPSDDLPALVTELHEERDTLAPEARAKQAARR